MAIASEIRTGAVIRLDNQLYKVVDADTHSGGARAGTIVHMKLHSLSTGTITERRFPPLEKVDALSLDRVKMQYLYSKGDSFTFMNPKTYDQIDISRQIIGRVADFLKENDEAEIEFFEEKPLSVIYHEIVELKVSTTGEGIRGQSDSTFKEAELENGIKLLVPQFIVEGDMIRVTVETGKYLARVSKEEQKKTAEKDKKGES